MKRLLAILVVLTLVVGTVSAVDLSGTVFGHVNVMQGSNEYEANSNGKMVRKPIGVSGGMDRVRIDGSGSPNDNFGGYLRIQGDGGISTDTASAWWKPIDQFKLIIGNNSDGQWGKEGVTGWGFNQMPNDSGIALNYGIWFGDGWGSSLYGGDYKPMHNRYTFFEGFVEYGAMMEITPFDIVNVNLAIPFMRGGEFKDALKAIIAQVNINLDFGNIAFTYDGGGRAVSNYGDEGGIFAYFGGNFGDSLGIDFGVSYHLAEDSHNLPPLGIGVGVKFSTDSFGIKFRTTMAIAGDDKVTWINSSILPSFAISDNLSVFLNAGLGIMSPKSGDAVVGFYINPYLRVGAEWGPTFYFGFQLSASGEETGGKKGDSKNINWAVPISLMVSF